MKRPIRSLATFTLMNYLDGRPNDQASGYTITELQSFLIANPGNWYNLRTYLQNNSNNPTEAAALQLFSDYD